MYSRFGGKTAYPIVFFGVRDGCLDVFEVPLADQTPEKLKALTYAFLGVLTFTAVFVTDLGLINAVGGGLVASMIVFVFPTIMFGTAVLKRLGDKKSDTQELLLPSGLTVFGVLVGVFGAWTAIQNVLR